MGPRSSRGVCFAALSAQIPTPPTKASLDGVRNRKHRGTRRLQSAIRQSAICAIVGYRWQILEP
eukprot:995275-Alexandrium_andersonii.AAC.1